jgi:hypothetical protein
MRQRSRHDFVREEQNGFADQGKLVKRPALARKERSSSDTRLVEVLGACKDGRHHESCDDESAIDISEELKE